MLSVPVVGWPILFKVLTLNVDICIVLMHFRNFCFSLSSVAGFSNTEARAPASAGRVPFLLTRRMMWFEQVVWVWVMVIFRWLRFFLIYRSHPNRWAAVVTRLSYLIPAVVPWDSYVQHLVWYSVDSLSLSAFTSNMLFPMASEKIPPPVCITSSATFLKFIRESLFMVHCILGGILFFG